MHRILSFSENPIIGGKAENLVFLDNNGLTPDFVVLAYDYLDKLFESNDLPSNSLWPEICNSVDLLGKGPYIARSSVKGEDSHESSYAGLFLSQKFEDISGLENAIKNVWESRNNSAAAEYRRIKHNISKNNDFNDTDDAIEMGIVIQKYIKADYGMVLFSSNYNGIDYIYGEYAVGGIEKIVSSSIIPYYFISLNNMFLLYSPSAPMLTEIKDFFLFKDSLITNPIKEKKQKNEPNYGVDMEIALCNGQAFVVQMRPITKLINPFNMEYVLTDNEVFSNWTDSFKLFSDYLRILCDYLHLPKIELKLLDGQICIKGVEIINILKEIAIEKMLTNSEAIVDLVNELYIQGLKILADKIYNTSLLNSWSLFKMQIAILDCYINFCIYHISGVLIKNLGIEGFSKKFDKFIFICDKRGDIGNYIPNSSYVLHKETSCFCKYKIIENWFDGKIDTLLALLKKKNYSLYISVKKKSFSECFGSHREYKFQKKNKAFADRKVSDYNGNIILEGIQASPGNAIGMAILADRDIIPKDIPKNSIIIAETLHLSWIYYLEGIMKNIAGIVVENPGLVSHPAIIARELGIPCLVACFACTRLIKTGDKVRIQNSKLIRESHVIDMPIK